MNEKLNEITDKIKDAVEIISQKADDVITIQGLKSQKRGANRAINQEYVELGKAMYAKYQAGEDLGEEAVTRCKKIDDQVAFIEQLDEEIINIQIKDDFDLDDEEGEEIAPEAEEEAAAEENAEETTEEAPAEE